jgi:hypothetical protein
VADLRTNMVFIPPGPRMGSSTNEVDRPTTRVRRRAGRSAWFWMGRTR